MSEIGLAASGLHKIYKNGLKEVKAVNGISLEVKKGSSVAIVGPSGAGKSTLLHLMGGLDKPTSGRVALDGVDIYRLSDRERAKIRNRRIGFVFQFYHLLPEFTALENVMMPALIRGNGIRKRAMDLLESVGLEDRAGHRPGELSGGESQRVAIARALVNEPEILLCDEPTGNLDSKTSESIYGLLFDLKSKANMALVIVTHNEGLSSKVERIIRIKDGKIV
ncbi:MAG: ABC transporter ATP-binding protein [Candidatus Omnitrophota bacterium]|nr:ABC transporter ATP-binding protein [Candidatus Omnitrophota bacterium]